MLLQERVARLRKEDRQVSVPLLAANHGGGNILSSSSSTTTNSTTTTATTTNTNHNNNNSSSSMLPLLAPPPSSNIHTQRRRSRSLSRRPLSPPTTIATSPSFPFTTTPTTTKSRHVTPKTTALQQQPMAKAAIVTPESSPIASNRPSLVLTQSSKGLPLQQPPQQRLDFSSSSSFHSNGQDVEWPVPSTTVSTPIMPVRRPLSPPAATIAVAEVTPPAVATTTSTSQQVQQPRRVYQRHPRRTPPAAAASTLGMNITSNNTNIHDMSIDSTASIIPESYSMLIRKAFGHVDDYNQTDDDIDLYRDVLQVDRFTATDKDIRIAYFRRGRQVLASNAASTTNSTTTTNNNTTNNNNTMDSERSKLQFQAVSMAYEILSNPQWKRQYDECGFTWTGHVPFQPHTPRPPKQPQHPTVTNNPSMHSNHSSAASQSNTSISEESVMLESLQQQLTTIHANATTPRTNNRSGARTSTNHSSNTSHASNVSGYSSDSGTFGTASHSPFTTPSKKKKHKTKRSSSSESGRRRRSHSVGVRWHDYVEELVFEKEHGDEQARLERRRLAKLAKQESQQHNDNVNDNVDDSGELEPEEGDEDPAGGRSSNSNNTTTKDKKKRKKHRVLVEPGGDDTDTNLATHLTKLNRETGSFVVGLLDQLEASIDQFMNLDGEVNDDDDEMELDDFDQMLLAKRRQLAYRRKPSKDEDDEDEEDSIEAVPVPPPTQAFVPTSVRRRRSVSDFQPQNNHSATNNNNNVTTSTTTSGGNVVTNFLQKVTASFDDFMLLEGTDGGEKVVVAGNDKVAAEPVAVTPIIPATNPTTRRSSSRQTSPASGPLPSPATHTPSPAAEWEYDDIVQEPMHQDDEKMTEPLMEWLQPAAIRAASPDPVPQPPPPAASRKRSSSRQARSVSTASLKSNTIINNNNVDTPELVSGPVADWGRETTDYGHIPPPPPLPQPVLLEQQQQHPVQENTMPPLGAVPTTEQQYDMPPMEYSFDDGLSAPPPPVQEVRKLHRHLSHSRQSSSSSYQNQPHDDDMSSLSESFAAYIWSEPPSCWTIHPPFSDDNSFQAAPSSRLLLAAPTPADTSLPLGTSMTTSAGPSSPRSALTSILKPPKFQSTAPPPPQLNADGYNPTNPFNDLDEYDDDPSSRGGGYSTPSNSIISGSDMQSSTTNNRSLFPNIRITIHDDNDYGMSCFNGCTNGSQHYEDARLGGQAFLRSLTKYMEEMSHDLAAACNGGGSRDGSVAGGGCPQNAKALLQSFMISDQDLEGLLNVLQCEMDKHQVVPKHQRG